MDVFKTTDAARRCRRSLFACLALVVIAGAQPAIAASPSTALPISLDAASSDFDYRNNLLVFRKVRISQGEVSVEADEATATGLEFENSEWRFTGSVRIRMQNGQLDSEAATVTFRGNQITRASITGKPASFEQRRVEQQVARGRAGAIDYDVSRGTIELTDMAWLSDGNNEITGQTLVYDMLKERVFANPGEQDPGGVSITINPRTVTPPAPPVPGTTPGSAP